MNWSVSTSGNPSEVARTVRETLTGYQLNETGEAAKMKSLELIESVLATTNEDYLVRVQASGTQSSQYDGHNIKIDISYRA